VHGDATARIAGESIRDAIVIITIEWKSSDVEEFGFEMTKVGSSCDDQLVALVMILPKA
jgi:hypothetical protein